MRKILRVIVLGGLVACGSQPAAERPNDKSVDAAHELAAKVIEAHGGLDAWRAAPTISYEHELMFVGADKPWISRETIENTEQRRLYQDIISHGGQLSWDGHDVWSVNWKLDNPPRIQPFLSLYSLITPFLTLDQMVTLEITETARLPKDNTDYLTLTIRPLFDPQRPPTAGFYKMFIDPKTYQVKGVAYNVIFGHMLDLMELPPEVTELGPMIHVFEEMTVVDGILVPTRYWTQGPDGGVAGTHLVRNWSFRKTFDNARMIRPANAIIDRSPHSRAQ